MLGENVGFFGECRFNSFRSGRHGWTRIRCDNVHQGRSQHVIHGEEDDIQWLLGVFGLDQVIEM